MACPRKGSRCKCVKFKQEVTKPISIFLVKHGIFSKMLNCWNNAIWATISGFKLCTGNQLQK